MGKIPDSIEVLKMIARGSPRICREYFRRRIGHEYKPWDLLDDNVRISVIISSGSIGRNIKEPALFRGVR